VGEKVLTDIIPQSLWQQEEPVLLTDGFVSGKYW